MLFDNNNRDDICPMCNKNVEEMFEKDEFCESCYTKGEMAVAQMTVLEHLWAVLVCVFLFKFRAALLELMWAIERLFRIGDYKKGGYFETQGRKWKWWKKGTDSGDPL